MDRFDGTLVKGKGCEKCLHTGYQGRVGVYELLVMSDNLRQTVMQSTDASILKKEALKEGMRGLNFDCAEKVLAGSTTMEEMLRVVFTEPDKENSAG